MTISRPGFQTFVNDNLPIGIAGDWASANPRASAIGGPGAFVAPAAGTVVGVAAWADPVTGLATNYYKAGGFLGIVHRNMQALITQFLGVASTIIPQGMEVSVQMRGDFYGIFASSATAKQKVYADPVTGALTAGATGASVTGSYTATTVTTSVMTTTDANLTGTAAAVGQAVTGGTLPEGTYIASSAGTGSGTHLWNLANVNGTAIPDQVSFTSSEFGVQEMHYTVASPVAADAVSTGSSISVAGVLTVASGITGVWQAGQFISGVGIPANVQILSQLTGTTGAAGTYQLNYAPAVAISAEAITATAGKIGAITAWD